MTKSIPQVFKNSSGKIATITGVEVTPNSIVSAFEHEYKVVGCRPVGVGFRIFAERLNDGFQAEFRPTELTLVSQANAEVNEVPSVEPIEELTATELTVVEAQSYEFDIVNFRSFNTSDNEIGFNCSITANDKVIACVHRSRTEAGIQFSWQKDEYQVAFVNGFDSDEVRLLAILEEKGLYTVPETTKVPEALPQLTSVKVIKKETRQDELTEFMDGIRSYGDLTAKVRAVLADPEVISTLLEVVQVYDSSNRNLGLARMNIGNRLRNLIKKNLAKLP